MPSLQKRVDDQDRYTHFIIDLYSNMSKYYSKKDLWDLRWQIAR